jgi:hypothetical protein
MERAGASAAAGACMRHAAAPSGRQPHAGAASVRARRRPRPGLMQTWQCMRSHGVGAIAQLLLASWAKHALGAGCSSASLPSYNLSTSLASRARRQCRVHGSAPARRAALHTLHQWSVCRHSGPAPCPSEQVLPGAPALAPGCARGNTAEPPAETSAALAEPAEQPSAGLRPRPGPEAGRAAAPCAAATGSCSTGAPRWRAQRRTLAGARAPGPAACAGRCQACRRIALCLLLSLTVNRWSATGSPPVVRGRELAGVARQGVSKWGATYSNQNAVL